MAGLLEIDDSLIAKIFEKMGVNVTGAVNAVEDKLARLPKVSGGNMYAGNNFSKALIQAEKEAKQMGDTYVSVEHLFLGMVDKADSDIKELLKGWELAGMHSSRSWQKSEVTTRWTAMIRRAHMRLWRSSDMIWSRGQDSRNLTR